MATSQQAMLSIDSSSTQRLILVNWNVMDIYIASPLRTITSEQANIKMVESAEEQPIFSNKKALGRQRQGKI
jgi:hypothetical protein